MFRTVITVIRIFFWMLGKDGQRRKALRLDREGKIAERDELVFALVPLWAQYVAKVTGTQVEVRGLEKIKDKSPVVIIANHQGIMDIPAIYGFIPKNISFVSKVEIAKIPILSDWMRLLQCTFMNRKSPRDSVKAIHDAADGVKKGYSQVIFPEGTRSKGGPHREFKPGSFKLAFLSGAPILPVTIQGTYKVYEERKKISRGSKVVLTVHDPVKTDGLSKEELAQIPAKVEKIVCAPLEEYAAAAQNQNP